eukprot:Phypoly_transcript_01565.p1 GENE.Phypoly_transcript_01565~~Phypoly_transcript_01565.p1  ORF type:complete len:546 (-),score=84.07 Phypoly_transcript_01565:1662-3230(-)
MGDDYEQTLLILKECFVYRIGPRPNAAGYKAQDWDPTKFIWSGRLVIVEKGDKCTIKFEDPNNSGEIFALCPVDDTAVEPVTDSSRYFVVRIQDGSGRHAFVGMGFTERNDAFDFNTTILDHLKHVKARQEQATAVQRLQSAPKVDYSLQGTIHVELKGATGKGTTIPKQQGNLGGGGLLLPPPPKARTSVKQPAQAHHQPQQQQQQQQVKVDVETSRNALRIAMETRDIGAATMSELSYQAEVIDLIERDVENIHNNLDKANRLVRGIESVGGTIANAFSSEKKTGRDVQFVDRTLVSKRIEVPVDIQILLKLKNDDLVPASLRFTAETFSVVNTQGPKRPEKDIRFQYENIESLWVRARPLHLDVRFKDKKVPRFRLMSSYVQSIVNEFCLRAKPKIGEVSVIFEPGTRKFVYGTTRIPLPSDNTATGGERKAAFFRKDAGAPALPAAFKNASDETKQGILQQEQDLAQISDLLGDMHGMATTIGGELERQSEQLDRITVRVDLADNRLQNTNTRIKNML